MFFWLGVNDCTCSVFLLSERPSLGIKTQGNVQLPSCLRSASCKRFIEQEILFNQWLKLRFLSLKSKSSHCSMLHVFALDKQTVDGRSNRKTGRMCIRSWTTLQMIHKHLHIYSVFFIFLFFSSVYLRSECCRLLSPSSLTYFLPDKLTHVHHKITPKWFLKSSNILEQQFLTFNDFFVSFEKRLSCVYKKRVDVHWQ